uniref:Tudor domain-containing protein 10 n=1 Tax=Pogona vitticeps TaxID=103695 RepID=A0ABM5F559_9SAUR
MTSRGKGRAEAQPQKKPAKPGPLRPAGLSQNKQKEIFIGNLPLHVKEVEIAVLLKDFGVKSVKKFFSNFKSFSFVELVSPEAAQLAVQRLNGIPWGGQRITVALKDNWQGHGPPRNRTEKLPKAATKEDRQVCASPQNNTEMPVQRATNKEQPVHESPPDTAEMPDLEEVPWEELGFNCDPVSKSDAQLCPSVTREVRYAVPMEMRSSFLLQMCKECFKDTTWLFSMANVQGKTGLLVMDTLPQTPYFWAIRLTEECHQKMQTLFTVLAEAERRLPFLAKRDVQTGMRCLAECSVGEEETAWNRCWVLDRGEDLAIVFFMDFGRSIAVPLNSLRHLDEDKFWAISPLAQPFVLQDEVLPHQLMRREIIEGTVVGPSEEPQILKFVLRAE